jgi:ubiquitin-protein ligase
LLKGKFIPRIFHLNIYPSGKIYVPSLKGWRSNRSISKMLLEIQDILQEPIPHSLACMDAYTLHRTDPVGYRQKLRECIESHLSYTMNKD